MLIRVYPRGLDVADDANQTPRDFYQETQECNCFLERPTSCWVQQVSDDENRENVENEIRKLEQEVERLTEELMIEEELEKKLVDRLEMMEEKLVDFSNATHGIHLNVKLKEVQETTDEEISLFEEQLLKLTLNLEQRYGPAEDARKYIQTFHDDIGRVYKDVVKTSESLKNELGELKVLASSE